MLVDYRATLLHDYAEFEMINNAIKEYEHRRPRKFEERVVAECRRAFLKFNPDLRNPRLEEVAYTTGDHRYLGVVYGGIDTITGSRNNSYRGAMQLHIDNTMCIISRDERDLRDNRHEFVMIMPNTQAMKPMYFSINDFPNYLAYLIGDDFGQVTESECHYNLLQSFSKCVSLYQQCRSKSNLDLVADIYAFCALLKWFAIAIRYHPIIEIRERKYTMRLRWIQTAVNNVSSKNYEFILKFVWQVYFKLSTTTRIMPSSENLRKIFHDIE